MENLYVLLLEEKIYTLLVNQLLTGNEGFKFHNPYFNSTNPPIFQPAYLELVSTNPNTITDILNNKTISVNGIIPPFKENDYFSNKSYNGDITKYKNKSVKSACSIFGSFATFLKVYYNRIEFLNTFCQTPNDIDDKNLRIFGKIAKNSNKKKERTQKTTTLQNEKVNNNMENDSVREPVQKNTTTQNEEVNMEDEFTVINANIMMSNDDFPNYW